jgi:hypothetical protein
MQTMNVYKCNGKNILKRWKMQFPFHEYPRANGAERRSGHKPGARVLIPPGYLHPGKRKH